MDKSAVDYLFDIFYAVLQKRPDISVQDALEQAETVFKRFVAITRPEQS